MRKFVDVKNIRIGGGAPVSVQSMTNTATCDVEATVAQTERLVRLGAQLVRCSVPDADSANALKEIVRRVSVPIIADIHFDYKLAIAAIVNGAAKIRVNPSNLSKEGIKEVVSVAKEYKVPIRIGVNQGSVRADITPFKLAELAMDSAKLMEDNGFTDIVLAVKSSSVPNTIAAYERLFEICDYPLHIGLTESGTTQFGSVKSTVAISNLLLKGIGDTLRVSLSSEPEKEVILGKQILRACGLDKDFVEVIACPTCARTQIPVEKLALEIENRTCLSKKHLKIAVMGCAVNGIGESKGANFGVCGGKEHSLIFKDGKPLKTVNNAVIIDELLGLLEEYDG